MAGLKNINDAAVASHPCTAGLDIELLPKQRLKRRLLVSPLTAAKQPAELHIYQSGGHGF